MNNLTVINKEFKSILKKRGMSSNDMGDLLKILDAEYLGNQVLSFDDIPPIETFVTGNLITPPESFLELMRSEGVVAIFKDVWR